MAKLKITQLKSEIGGKQNQRETLRSLGLKRINDVVVKDDRPEIRGMINVVSHLVTWEGWTDMAEEHALKLHHLRPAPGSNTPKTRVGRGEGGKGGKTAGRGTKGTKARYQVPHGFEGGQTPLHMRLPKLRGFKNPNKVTFQVINLDKLSALFPEGGDVTVADLVAKGAVRANQLSWRGEDHRRDQHHSGGLRSAEQKIVAAAGVGHDRLIDRWQLSTPWRESAPPGVLTVRTPRLHMIRSPGPW